LRTGWCGSPSEQFPDRSQRLLEDGEIQAVDDAGPILFREDQSGVFEDREMPRERRLGERKHFRELTRREIALPQHTQDFSSGRVTQSLEDGVHGSSVFRQSPKYMHAGDENQCQFALVFKAGALTVGGAAPIRRLLGIENGTLPRRKGIRDHTGMREADNSNAIRFAPHSGLMHSEALGVIQTRSRDGRILTNSATARCPGS